MSIYQACKHCRVKSFAETRKELRCANCILIASHHGGQIHCLVISVLLWKEAEGKL